MHCPRFLPALVLALSAPSVEAGRVFVCHDADGRTSVVDRACPGAVERREIAGAAAPAQRADPDAKQIAAWARASQARLPPSLGGSARPQEARARTRRGLDPHARACATARADRTRREREDGFHLDFGQRRRLLDAEIAACGLR